MNDASTTPSERTRRSKARLEFLHCVGRRSLLSGLLRAALPTNEEPSGELDLDDEVARVIWPFARDEAIHGCGFTHRLNALLESALRVAHGASRRETARDDLEDDDARSAEPLVEVHGGDDSFERVREDARLIAIACRARSTPEKESRAHAKVARERRESVGAHDVRAKLRELAFASVGEPPHELLAHDEPKHGVAEELEPLVIRLGACSGSRLLVLISDARV